VEYKNNIKKVVFGVLFNNSFKLLDHWGEIADDILYNSKYFSPQFFPSISSHYTTERNLYNSELGHCLTLTSSNIILTQKIIKNYNDEYNEFQQRIKNYIVPQILTKYNLITSRIGIVYTFEFDQNIIEKFASLYFKPEIKGIQNFRFSKKEATIKGRLLDKNNDFINKIFTVGNIDNDLLGISYDYQYHFQPLRSDIRDDISDFFSKSNIGLQNDIINNTIGIK